MTRPTHSIVPTVVLAACLAVTTPAAAVPTMPATPPKGVHFLKANQWPKVAGWGKWSGSSDPGMLTLLMCQTKQLPKPYGDTEYDAKKRGVSGREWISDAGSKKAAAGLVRSFGKDLRRCAEPGGYKRSASKVFDRTPKRSEGLKVFAEHLETTFYYGDKVRPGYRLWAIAQRGRFVVVVQLTAGTPRKSAPLKAFIRTAHAAVDGAL